MDLPEFLEMADGEIRLAGHRVGLYHVVQDYNNGSTAELIAAHMPTLPLALIHKTIAFYLENQADVDAYAASYRADLDRLETEARSAGSPPTLAQLRERLGRMQQAGRA